MNFYKGILALGIIICLFHACRYKKVEIKPDPDHKPGPTSSIPDSGTTIAVATKKIYIKMFDWSDPDNDLMSVYNNGNIISSSVNVNTVVFVEVPLDKGKNKIEIKTESVGGVGGQASPNISICPDQNSCSGGFNYALDPGTVITYWVVR